jgi:histone methylation protein DOT1
MKPSTLGTLLAALLGAAGCAPYPAFDAPFLVTPPEIVEQMLRLAGVTPTDIVYDLGSGDGRLVIAAVQDFRARAAIGIGSSRSTSTWGTGSRRRWSGSTPTAAPRRSTSGWCRSAETRG